MIDHSYFTRNLWGRSAKVSYTQWPISGRDPVTLTGSTSVHMSMYTLTAIWGIGQTPCSFEHYLVRVSFWIKCNWLLTNITSLVCNNVVLFECTVHTIVNALWFSANYSNYCTVQTAVRFVFITRSSYNYQSDKSWGNMLHYYVALAVSTRPPAGVVLPPAALAARRLQRLASLLEL